MAFESDAMYSAVTHNEPQKVIALLRKYPDADLNDTSNKLGTPLVQAVERFVLWPHKVGRYQCQILLLGAGANPFQPVAATSLRTPFSIALNADDLLALRLMMMARPPSPDHGKVYLEKSYRIKRNIIVRAEPSLTFAQCLDDTIRDGWQIRCHKETATQLANIGNLVAAASEYEKAAALYAAQAALEAELIYPPFPTYLHHKDDDPIESARPVAIAYYQKKEGGCLAQLHKWYQVIDETLRNTSTGLTAEIKNYHIEVLDRQVVLGQRLGIDTTEALRYLTSLLAAQPGPVHSIAKVPVPREGVPLISAPRAMEAATSGSGAREDERTSLLSEESKKGDALSWLSWVGLGASAGEAKKDH